VAHYTADLAGSRYPPLDQINAVNFSKLEVAWRFKTDSIGNRPEFKLEGTPLEVGGVVYATAGSRRGVVALDAATGELLWVHSEREGARGARPAPALRSRPELLDRRKGAERILYVTPGYRLVALDAKTGMRSALRDRRHRRPEDRLRPADGPGHRRGGPALRADHRGEHGHRRRGVPRGLHAGEARQQQGLRPRPTTCDRQAAVDLPHHPEKGESGYETWLNGSAEDTGNTGVWTQITVDRGPEPRLPGGRSPTSDFYGGHRPGNGLYGNSLVAVDLTTGQRKWHYQLIHHEIWDYDNSSAPLLMDITVGGKPIKAVALPSKQGFLYVFDRDNGSRSGRSRR
jgi:quinoprotein glucose dehydrogenase